MDTNAFAVSQNLPPVQLDFMTVKARQQGAWAAGDYAVVGTTLQIVGEELCEALDLGSNHCGRAVLVHSDRDRLRAGTARARP